MAQVSLAWMYGVELHHPDADSLICQRLEELLEASVLDVQKVVLPGHHVFYYIGFTLSVCTGTGKLGSGIPYVDQDNWRLALEHKLTRIPRLKRMVRAQKLEPGFHVVATSHSYPSPPPYPPPAAPVMQGGIQTSSF